MSCASRLRLPDPARWFTAVSTSRGVVQRRHDSLAGRGGASRPQTTGGRAPPRRRRGDPPGFRPPVPAPPTTPSPVPSPPSPRGETTCATPPRSCTRAITAHPQTRPKIHGPFLEQIGPPCPGGSDNARSGPRPCAPPMAPPTSSREGCICRDTPSSRRRAPYSVVSTRTAHLVEFGSRRGSPSQSILVISLPAAARRAPRDTRRGGWRAWPLRGARVRRRRADTPRPRSGFTLDSAAVLFTFTRGGGTLRSNSLPVHLAWWGSTRRQRARGRRGSRTSGVCRGPAARGARRYVSRSPAGAGHRPGARTGQRRHNATPTDARPRCRPCRDAPQRGRWSPSGGRMLELGADAEASTRFCTSTARLGRPLFAVGDLAAPPLRHPRADAPLDKRTDRHEPAPSLRPARGDYVVLLRQPRPGCACR